MRVRYPGRPTDRRSGQAANRWLGGSAASRFSKNSRQRRSEDFVPPAAQRYAVRPTVRGRVDSPRRVCDRRSGTTPARREAAPSESIGATKSTIIAIACFLRVVTSVQRAVWAAQAFTSRRDTALRSRARSMPHHRSPLRRTKATRFDRKPRHLVSSSTTCLSKASETAPRTRRIDWCQR